MFVFYNDSKVILIKGMRQDEGFIQYSPVDMPCVLIDLIGVLNGRLHIGLTPLHFRVFGFNVFIPPILAACYEDAILIPTRNTCHIYTFTLSIALAQIHSPTVQIHRSTIVLSDKASLVQTSRNVNQSIGRNTIK